MRVAALTMVYNEPVWARVWADHYTREVGAANCLVLDHGSTDGSTGGLGVAVERMRRSALDEDVRARRVSDCVRQMLTRYDAVVHTDVDELLIADPARHADLRAYAAVAPEVATAVGLDLQHLPDEEPAWDPSRRVGAQRRWVRFSGAMCKPALVRRPVRWEPGFHHSDAAGVFGDLYLIHLRYADLGAGLGRLARTREQAFANAETNPHQRVSDAAFEGMVRQIAQLPRAGEMDEVHVGPWREQMLAGWQRGDRQLSMAGDALWSLPAAIRRRL